MPPLAPVTEEDQDGVKAMLKRLDRLRKREHAHGKKWYTELDDAIEALQKYGAVKGWWEYVDQ